MPYRFGWPSEFSNSLGGGLALQGEVGPISVVLCFPPFELSRQILFVLERPSSIELLRVCLVAPFYLAVYLWASGRDVAVRNAEIRKMPSELRSKRRVIVCLYFLNGKRKMLTNLH